MARAQVLEDSQTDGGLAVVAGGIERERQSESIARAEPLERGLADPRIRVAFDRGLQSGRHALRIFSGTDLTQRLDGSDAIPGALPVERPGVKLADRLVRGCGNERGRGDRGIAAGRLPGLTLAARTDDEANQPVSVTLAGDNRHEVSMAEQARERLLEGEIGDVEGDHFVLDRPKAGKLPASGVL